MNRLLVFLFSATLSSCSVVSVTEYNDFFATFLRPNGANDNNFSQGLTASYTMKAKDAPSFLNNVAGNLPSFQGVTKKEMFSEPDEIAVEVGQLIYTPDDLATTKPVLNDVPYGAMLYGELLRRNVSQNFRYTTGLTLGVIGPNAFGKEVQTWFHELCDCQNPNGWENQLSQELIIGLSHSREEREPFYEFCGGRLAIDYINSVGYDLGNSKISFETAREYRIGYNLPSFTDSRAHFSAFFFNKLGGGLIGRNIFYDGNTFTDSLSVDREIVVGENRSGLALVYGGWALRLYWVIRSRDFQQQEDAVNSYGAFSLGREFSIL